MRQTDGCYVRILSGMKWIPHFPFYCGMSEIATSHGCVDMRDHRKLRAFELADALVLEVYAVTATFPREEMFGLTSQLRRGAVSIASNIVEGCTRSTSRDYLHFLVMAHGAARELHYQLTVAERLDYLPDGVVVKAADEVCRVLGSLTRRVDDAVSN